MYMESHIAEIDKEKAIVNVHAKEYVQTWKRTSPISIPSIDAEVSASGLR